MLAHVPLTCTSTLGIVYVASPLKSVLKGSAMRQYGFVTERLPAAVVTWTFAVTDWFGVPVGPVPSSGNFARTSQPSASLRPVLVPPCTRQPRPQPRDDVDIHAVPVLGLRPEVFRGLRELVHRPDLFGTRL